MLDGRRLAILPREQIPEVVLRNGQVAHIRDDLRRSPDELPLDFERSAITAFSFVDSSGRGGERGEIILRRRLLRLPAQDVRFIFAQSRKLVGRVTIGHFRLVGR